VLLASYVVFLNCFRSLVMIDWSEALVIGNSDLLYHA